MTGGFGERERETWKTERWKVAVWITLYALLLVPIGLLLLLR